MSLSTFKEAAKRGRSLLSSFFALRFSEPFQGVFDRIV
jgi:hypothetical protein